MSIAMARRQLFSNASGFALLDVVIASAIAATIAAGSCMLLSIAIRANQRARAQTVETMAAARKMEQLRSLEWTHITTSFPSISMSTSDLTSDLSADPASDDGPGLLRSPPGTLTGNMDSYVDYLDANGGWLGRGGSVPASAVYVRRWSVQPHSGDPDNVLVLEVVVGRRGSSASRLADPIHLVTIEARK
jgi:hypothetical protein